MKQVMTRAWEIAKAAVIKFGGSSKEYIAEAMKIAWSETKASAVKIVAVKDWFIRNNFNSEQAYAISDADRFEIVSETEKAYKLRVVTGFGKIVSWFPKSVCMTQEQVDAEEVARKKYNTRENGLEKNMRLLMEARELGVKGLRERNRTETLERKIADRKLELGIA